MLTRGLMQNDGLFNNTDQLIAADLKVGLTVGVNDGSIIQWYKTAQVSSGGLLLDNGNYANPVSQSNDNLLKIKSVSSPYTLLESDKEYQVIYFEDPTDVTLNIPDGLSVGLNVLALNIGGGGLSIVNTGTETTRGSLILGNVDGYMAIFKLNSTTWQSSERA